MELTNIDEFPLSFTSEKEKVVMSNQPKRKIQETKLFFTGLLFLFFTFIFYIVLIKDFRLKSKVY